MNKNILHRTFLFFFLCLTQNLFSQTINLPLDSARSNPLRREGSVVGSQDYAVVFEYLSGSTLKLRAALRRNLDSAATHYVESSADTFNVPGLPGGNRTLASISADVDGDGRDELVYALTTNDAVEVYCLFLNPTDSNFTYQSYSTPYTVLGASGPSNIDAPNNYGRVVLDKADINNDGQYELILGYYNAAQSALQFQFLRMGVSANLLSSGSYQLSSVDDNNGLGEYWHFTTEDLDFDLLPELVIAYSYNQNQSYLRVMEFNNTVPYNLTQQSELDLLADLNLSNNFLRIACLRSGDINGDLVPEMGVFTYNDIVGQRILLYNVGDQPGGAVNYLSKIERLPLTFPAFSNAYDGYANSVINRVRSFDARMGDVNFDGIDDIVIADNRYIGIFPGNTDINQIIPNFTAPVELNETYLPPIPGPNTSDFLQLADLNRNGSKSIILSWNAFLNNTDLSWQVIASRYFTLNADNTSLSSDRVLRQTPFAFPNCANAYRYATTTGDYTGDSYRLGLPTLYDLPGIVQPLVILSAPPAHSDNVIAPDSLTDLLGCNGALCPFTVSYTASQDSEFSVSTEVHSDWSVGASVGVSAGIGVASVEAKLEASYGEGFSQKGTQTNSVTEVSTTTTQFDDVVYCSAINYKVRQFPLYRGGQQIGTVASVHPQTPTYQWRASRSPEMDLYFPLHEPGNILSFRKEAQFAQQSGIDQQLYQSLNGFGISGGTSFDWNVSFSNLSQTEESLNRDVSLAASLNGSVYGVEAGLSASFNMSQVATHTSSIQSSVDFKISLPTVTNFTENAPYTIYPRLFWKNGGVAVIDYAVEPTLPSPGTENFWSTWYNRPDPALNLPWRLDSLREIAGNETQSRKTKSAWITPHQSNTIAFNPQPGDTIDVHIRVFNYGLQNLSNGTLQCFMGHPELNGQSLLPLNASQPDISIGFIPSQGFKELLFTTVLPADTSLDGRLYIAINYNGATNDEVHENNNLGWILAGTAYTLHPEVFETGISPVPADELRMVAWPVPASNELHIYAPSFSNGAVQLEMLDLSGKCLFQKEVNLFQGKPSQALNVETLPDGLYYLRAVQNQKSTGTRILIRKN